MTTTPRLAEPTLASAIDRLTELARDLLADPRALRWTGAVAPWFVDGRLVALAADFVGGSESGRAWVAIGDAGAIDPRLQERASARGSLGWFHARGLPRPPGSVDAYEVAAWTREHAEYQAIAEHYSDRRARRSGVRLLHHIDEGIAVLRAIGASAAAIAGYCLHPLVQGDDDLRHTWASGALASSSPDAVALAFEYRAIANGFLSPMEEHPGYRDPTAIRRSPLADVDAMLIADKIQNRKDFLRYHRDHPRAEHLAIYFDQWLRALEVSAAEVERLTRWIDLPAPREIAVDPDEP